MEKTRHVAEYKKKIVADIVKYIKEYPIISLVNMENLPAPQLQVMKTKLRDKVHLFMTKKRLIKIALQQVKNGKKGVEELEKYFQGMPALLFTKDSPFKLSKTLQQSKSPAPAKAGQTSPKDIVIPKGPTSFAPGPIISELSSIGIKTGVEQGKVAVKEDSLVAKKGEKIKPKVAEVLTRMGIEPMEAGLDLVAAYENGTIYQKDILLIDEKEFMNKLNNACSGAFNLAIFISYLTKDTIKTLLGKAFNDAKAIGLSQNIIDSGIVEELLGKAERSMLNLKTAANIEVQEKPKEIVEKEIKEKPKEEKVEEKKEEIKPEVKEGKKEEVKEKPKPEVKVEEKKEEPKPEVKEEVKPEIKEEKKEIEEKEPEKKVEEKKPAIKEIVTEEKPVEKKAEEPKKEKEEEPKIEEKEAEKEEDIYEEESRGELIAEGEISPAEEGFMEGYEEAGKTEEEIKKEEKLSEVDKKVKEMVEDTKKFMAGEKEPTAEDLLKEEEKEEVKKEEVEEKEKIKKEVLSAHELAKKKKKDEQKEIEDLAQELIKKGSLKNKK